MPTSILVPADEADDRHFNPLTANGQMPMYNLAFDKVTLELEDLEARRDAAVWHEYGV